MSIVAKNRIGIGPVLNSFGSASISIIAATIAAKYKIFKATVITLIAFNILFLPNHKIQYFFCNFFFRFKW